jgi:hypothetical protein
MIIIVPAIGWAWPALLPLVSAAAAALGYKTFSDPKGILRGRTTLALESVRREVVPLDSVVSEVIADEIGNEERLLFERDDLILVFRKDALGKFYVEVVGPTEKTALDLKIRGEEFARELVKKFAYNKVQEQLARTNATVISEEVEENGAVTLRFRKWQ